MIFRPVATCEGPPVPRAAVDPRPAWAHAKAAEALGISASLIRSFNLGMESQFRETY